MTRTAKITFVAIALATLGLSVTGASAETWWQYNHPRREQVNERLAYQNYRIHREMREGELSPWQARRLHREDRMIRHEERNMTYFNHGHISPFEQRALNQQENFVSRHIGR
jgi:hypothetical protein